MGSQPLRRQTTDRAVAPSSTAVLDRAVQQRDARMARQRIDIWSLTPEQRIAAFWDGEFSVGQCLEWSRRAAHEVPRAPDGEFLYIACRTPEWLGE